MLTDPQHFFEIRGASQPGRRLVVVSNRLPFTVSAANGSLQYQPSSGGLTTGLWSWLSGQTRNDVRPDEVIWVGWPGAPVPRRQQHSVRTYAQQHFNACPVFLDQSLVEKFYDGFCNNTLWPLFHYFPFLARYEEDCWQAYRRANETYAESLAPMLRAGDLVWVHDFQLMLLPRLIRERFPGVRVGFFLHIPFPCFEVFRLLPEQWRAELLEGVLGAGLAGFHTPDYGRYFIDCVSRTCGHRCEKGAVALPGRAVGVGTYPMGIDFERFASAAASAETAVRARALRARFAGQKVIFSVDRLDYTKGLLNRLHGYDQFLRGHPEWRGKVVFVLSVAPSRITVPSYRAMRHDLEQTVGRIAGRHGTVQWTPLVYQYRNVEFDELVALYHVCDIALITPLRDGMNLVAKEFVASRTDGSGALVLSEFAGAAREMPEALLINPFHDEEFARALEQALEMPLEEQTRRNGALQARLRRCDVNRWADRFIEDALTVETRTVPHAWLQPEGTPPTLRRPLPKRAAQLPLGRPEPAFF